MEKFTLNKILNILNIKQMKKLIIILTIILSSGIFTGCMEEDISPADEHGTMEEPSDNGL